MKKIIILLVLAFISLSVNAQTFQKTFGSPNSDVGNYVQQTTDGGYIIAGSAEDFILGSYYDGYLIKTDADGNVVWSKTYGNTDYEEITSVQQTSDGGYIVSGNLSNPQDIAFLIKTNSTGDTLWTKTFNDVNLFYSVKQTSDGGYVVAGKAVGIYGFAVAVKVDFNGNILWSKKYGNDLLATDLIYVSVIQQTTDGGFIVSGNRGCGNCPMFLLKLNSIGDTLWTKVYEPFLFAGNSVQQTSDGGFITGGSYLSGGVDDGAAFVKTDENGNVVWYKVYTLPNWGNVKYLRQTSDGGYISCLQGNIGEIFLLKINSSGNFVWSKQYNPTNTEQIRHIQQTNDGGFVFVGKGPQANSDIFLVKTDSNGTSGCNEVQYLLSATSPSITAVSAQCQITTMNIITGNLSIYVTAPTTIENTLCTTVGVNDIANKIEISIFPNPVSDILNLEFQSNKNEKIEIIMTNLLGQKVLQKTFKTEKDNDIISFGVREIPNGIFLLQIKSKDNIFIKKIIKE